MTDTSTRPPRTGAEDVRWDLSDLYTDPSDPALAGDLATASEAAEKFAARYRGAVAGLEPGGLTEACAALEAVWLPVRRAGGFAHLRFAADTADPATGALVARVQEVAAAISVATLFFELEWAAIDDTRAGELLADPSLDGYRNHLTKVRRLGPHQLSEPEERILSELEPTGPTAWTRLHTQLTSALRVDLDGAALSLDEATSALFDADRDRRRRAQEAITAALAPGLPTRAFVVNTLLQDKATRDRLRAHPHWLHERNLANEVDDGQVSALIEAVCGRYDLVGRYYRLKQRLLGLDELFDWDRYAPVESADEPTVSWEDARRLVLDAYQRFSPRFADLAREFFDHDWIDAPPSEGKQGGAFAAAVTPEVHPYVLLNYAGRPRDVLTLAHELGHGVHFRLAQRQTLVNQQTPLTTAETASIFGETVTLQRLLEVESDPGRRLTLRCRRIEDAFAAIFRQVAMNRFEEAIHTHRREHGELSPETFAEHWTTTQEAMFAGSVTLTQGYQSWWSYIPHFVAVPGYVYAYAYGNLLAFALYRRYEEEGDAFVPRYLDLLAAGGSEPPHVLLAAVGVDLTDPGFWDAGLDLLEEEVADAERLAGESTP